MYVIGTIRLPTKKKMLHMKRLTLTDIGMGQFGCAMSSERAATTWTPPQEEWDAEAKAAEKWFLNRGTGPGGMLSMISWDGAMRAAALYKMSELSRLQQENERLKRENEHFTKSCIVEIAVRNPQVAEYVKHWEARAESAERELKALREQMRWIPVEEKLPTLEHGGVGLVPCDFYVTLDDEQFRGFYDPLTRQWTVALPNDDWTAEVYDVTHWRALDPGPEGGR